MSTNEGPLRWKIWNKFNIGEKLLEGREVNFMEDKVTLRFIFLFVFFFPFIIILRELDDRIQSKKLAKGYNLQRQKIYNLKWRDL